MNNIMNEISRRDAIIIDVAFYFLYRRQFPTAAELTATHNAGGENWDKILSNTIRAAIPLVTEEGTWTHHDGEQAVVENIDLPLLIKAAGTARYLNAMNQEGLHTAGHALSEISRQYRTTLDRTNLTTLHEALATERGLTD